jgi:hypothetical protein
VEESLQHLPAAVDCVSSKAFREYLVEHLHQNGLATRRREALRLSKRFSENGVINQDLARSLKIFGDTRCGREIVYYEYLRAIPLLQEVAVRWLAPLTGSGGTRQSLLDFLKPLLGSRGLERVAKHTVQTFRLFGKLRIVRPSAYIPIWSEPPLQSFLYMLAQHFPDRAMVRVESFTGENIVRAMLWPAACISEMLKAAERSGHISKISHLDQYHQFTLAGTGQERMHLLLWQPPSKLNEGATDKIVENCVKGQPTVALVTHPERQTDLFSTPQNR